MIKTVLPGKVYACVTSGQRRDKSHVVQYVTNIKVTIIGENGKAQIPFTKADAQALIQVSDLATALQATTTLQAQRQELIRRITFYEGRR